MKHLLVAASAAALCAVATTGPVISQDATTGYYTAEQAAHGKAVWGAQCAVCHGNNLEGTEAPGLVGIDVMGNWGTAQGLYDYYSVAMPATARCAQRRGLRRPHGPIIAVNGAAVAALTLDDLPVTSSRHYRCGRQQLRRCVSAETPRRRTAAGPPPVRIFPMPPPPPVPAETRRLPSCREFTAGKDPARRPPQRLPRPAPAAAPRHKAAAGFHVRPNFRLQTPTRPQLRGPCCRKPSPPARNCRRRQPTVELSHEGCPAGPRVHCN